MNFVWVGLGGAIGSILRYGVGVAIPRGAETGAIPWSTVLVNSFGCFLIGCLFAFIPKDQLHQNSFWLFAAIGILGGFTTFSTFGLDTLRLFREGAVYGACIYVGLTLILSLACTGIGFSLGERLSHR